MNTKFTENVKTLTATVTALELEASFSSPTTTIDECDFPFDDHSSGEDHLTSAEMSTPNSSSPILTDIDEESQSEEAVVNNSTNVAQQVQMHCGNNISAVTDDESNVSLSPLDNT